MGWHAGSVQLQLVAGGRWTAARGAAVSQGAAARKEEEDNPGWAKLGRTAGYLRPARKNSGDKKRKKKNNNKRAPGNFGPD
jgi:hypothetical protein